MTDIDLSDVSVLLSMKVESAARTENLERVAGFYETFTKNAEIILVEQGNAQATDLPVAGTFKRHIISDSGLHWKTRNLNRAAALSMRPRFLFTDVDMVPHPNALAQALSQLDAGATQFQHLFDGLVLNIPRKVASTFRDWPSFLKDLPYIPRESVTPGTAEPRSGLVPLYGDANHRATGGGFLCQREAFYDVGGFNENFVSYGAEDQEFHLRVEKLGYDFPYLDGSNLYHFDHPRGSESRYGPFYRQNMAELERIAAMDQDGLRQYVVRGFSSMPLSEGFVYERQSGPNSTGWRRHRDTRRDLSDVSIMLIADPKRVSLASSCLNELLEHLEATYRNADIRICEPRTSEFKFPDNRSHVVHHPIDGRVTGAALRAIRQQSDRPKCLVCRLSPNSASQLGYLKDRISGLFASRSPAKPSTANSSPTRQPGHKENAIYLRFDDGFKDYARACLNSLRINYPDHPTVLVDYDGQDTRLNAIVEEIEAVRLPPEPAPHFTRHLHRKRARESVIARFRLWRSAYRDYETILHLDTDTLVLGPLNTLFERTEPFIVANHEQSPEVRIFQSAHQKSTRLTALLREDGLTYPGHPDDMGNAGVFTLPRSYRSRENLSEIARLAERYGDYLAYADQSLISLWLRSRGVRPNQEFAYNFQSPFFTDREISVPFEDIRILHFSSYRKPGNADFNAWRRVGDMHERLTELFEEYRAQ